MVRKKVLPFLVIIVLLLLSSLALASESGKYAPASEVVIVNLTPINKSLVVGGVVNNTFLVNFTEVVVFESEEEPRMMVHPKEFEDTIYQGSYTTFTIVIEEISGEAPLKDVEILYPVPSFFTDQRMIPEEWIKFDKEYIEEIPAGGSATVTCTIEVPKDAKPGTYIGVIGIDAGNIPSIALLNETDKPIPKIIPDKTVVVKIHVKKDSIPPKIIIYSPKDGEVVNKPYIIVEGVVRDNIGVKRIEINGEIVSPILSTIGEEVDVEFKKEVQLMEGWNEIEIEAEDYAGNIAYELIRVKYEPIEIILTPIPIETIEVNITPAPKIKSSTLKYLDLEIEPKYYEASPGEVINYVIILNWSPREWRGEVKAKVILEAAGFKKEWDLPSVEVNQDPPITVNIPVEIPNVPPLTYKLRLIVEAEGLIDEDYTELRVKALGIPGFESILVTLALASAFILRKVR